jgi:putative isomerase
MSSEIARYSGLIRENLFANYPGMFREAGANLPYPFVTPGSQQYADVLWDWDSWLTNVALRQILLESGDGRTDAEIGRYEQGCILNFLHYGGMDGWIPVIIPRSGDFGRPANPFNENMHKPCLAQHAAFITRQNGGDAESQPSAARLRPAFLADRRDDRRG